MQLLCIGDLALGAGKPREGRLRRPVGPVVGDDVRVLLNWELPVGEMLNPAPRVSGPRIIAHPDAPRAIEDWPPGFATLATNHILDAGAEGLAQTMEALRRVGLATVGAGQCRDEIVKPLIWETPEGCLAIVNWVFPETHPDWMAVPGPNCWPGPAEAERHIRDLRRDATWVLVAVHWSDELFPFPRPQDREIGRALARMGADLVIGHHPHVVRGAEIVGHCPVFYSLGNFYFEDVPDGRGGWVVREAPRNREGLGVQISFRRGETPQYRPVSFWNTKRGVAPDRYRRAGRRLASVSRVLERLDGAGYARWYADERARFDKWSGRWHFGFLRLGMGGSVRRLLQKALLIR